jgi:hypothetical protein
MLKYQLDKPELLINTDWGLPINDLSASDAQAQGLVKLNDRWTTPEDKKRLKVEHRVYSWIHLTILLTTIGGVVNSLMGASALITKPGLEAKLEAGFTLYLGVFALVTAYHLRRYEPFGRACAMVLGALNVIGVVVLFFERGMASGASLAVCWHVVWSIAIARLFFSPIGNIVFSGKAKAAPAPIERKEEVA